MIPTAGLWRFTFTGVGFVPAAPYTGGAVTLSVDGRSVAGSYLDLYGDNSGYVPLSIDTLQKLQIGQNVTIDFANDSGSSSIWDNDFRYTHWTGNYMQSGAVVPPECQYTGQGCDSIGNILAQVSA